LFVKHDDMIEAFAPYRADQSFHKRILPRRHVSATSASWPTAQGPQVADEGQDSSAAIAACVRSSDWQRATIM